MNKKALSTSIIAAIVVVLVVLGGVLYVVMKGSSPTVPAVSSSELSKCLSTIDESKLPASLGGFVGNTQKLSKFTWTMEGKDSVMPASSKFTSAYKNGQKQNIAILVGLDNEADINIILNDVKNIKKQRPENVKETELKGAKVYVYSAPSTQGFYIFAGDKKFVAFTFLGTTENEAQSWVTTWANTVC